MMIYYYAFCDEYIMGPLIIGNNIAGDVVDDHMMWRAVADAPPHIIRLRYSQRRKCLRRIHEIEYRLSGGDRDCISLMWPRAPASGIGGRWMECAKQLLHIII